MMDDGLWGDRVDGGWGWEEGEHNQEGYDEEESRRWKGKERAHMARRAWSKKKSTRITDGMNT